MCVLKLCVWVDHRIYEFDFRIVNGALSNICNKKGHFGLEVLKASALEHAGLLPAVLVLVSTTPSTLSCLETLTSKQAPFPWGFSSTQSCWLILTLCFCSGCRSMGVWAFSNNIYIPRYPLNFLKSIFWPEMIINFVAHI